MMRISDPSVMLCNSCKKRIPVKGVQIKQKEQGEYQVTYFTCPHCGQVYQITTTDQEQRELLERQKVERKKLETAERLKFRRETVREYRKSLIKLGKTLEKRAEGLRKMGEEILHLVEKGDC